MKHILTILLVLTVATTAHAYKRTETIREYGANVYCTTCEKVTWHGFKAHSYVNDPHPIMREIQVIPATIDNSGCRWSLTCSVCGTVIQDDVRVTFKTYSGVEERVIDTSEFVPPTGPQLDFHTITLYNAMFPNVSSCNRWVGPYLPERTEEEKEVGR